MSPGRSRNDGMQRHHVETIKQVFAKGAALHRLFQIAVGRRDDADIGLRIFDSPTRSYSRSCRKRSSFGWISSGSSPISSRKSVPRSAAATLPHVVATAPVNAPFIWPKSSLSSNSRERLGQLTVTNGSLRARAPAMNLPRQHAFAGSAFARDEDRWHRSMPLFFAHLQHRFISGIGRVLELGIDAGFEHAPLQVGDADFHLPGLRDAFQNLLDLLRLERFCQVIERAALDRGHRRLDRRIGRDDNHRQPRRKAKKIRQQIEPVFRAEPDVEERDLEALRAQLLLRRGPVHHRATLCPSPPAPRRASGESPNRHR